MAHQVVGIIFVVCFWLSKLIRPRSSLAKKQDVVPLIFLYLLMIFGAAMSLVGAFMMLGAYTQFIKGFLEIVFMNIFLISLVLFFGENKYADAKKFLNILLIIAGLSSFYQFSAIYFQLSSGIFIDDLIWPNISSWSSSGNSGRALIGSGEARGFRHGGFLGSPNTMATFLICAVPIALYLSQVKTRWMFILVSVFFLSLLSGMSRSGIVGMVVALLTMLLIGERRRLKQLIVGFGLLVLIPILIYISEGWLDINIISGFVELVTNRLSNSSYQDSPRYELLLAGLDMFYKSPIFGSGINSSPILLQEYPIFSVTGGSIHNYWLELFVSTGFFAIPSVIFYLFLIFKSSSLQNIYYKALFVSLCGLMVNGVFHSSIAKPGIQVFIILLYMCAIAERVRVSNKSVQYAGR
jgi:hypothetical protein